MSFLKYKEFIKEEDSKYQIFFKGKLAKWNIESPNELSDSDKEKFFKEIQTEWEN